MIANIKSATTSGSHDGAVAANGFENLLHFGLIVVVIHNGAGRWSSLPEQIVVWRPGVLRRTPMHLSIEALFVQGAVFDLQSDSMQTLNIPGFEGQQIAVQVSTGFAAPKLFVNGQPAPPGPKKGQYLLRRNDGTEATAYFKGGFPDPVPVLVVGETPIRLAEPLTWYQWVWAGFPLILIF